MNEQTPQEILALIQYAEEENEKQERQRLDDQAVEELKQKEAAYDQARELYANVLPQIPDILRQFVVLNGVQVDDREHYDISFDEQALEFRIDGLAPILMVFEWRRESNRHEFDYWVVAGVANDDWDEETDLCHTAIFKFNQRFDQRAKKQVELIQVLLAAKIMADQLKERQHTLTQQIEFEIRRRAEHEARKKEERNEELALFNAIKNDSIAIHLLKAFVLLRDERTSFEEQLLNADEAMYSIENRWSRKAEELRRQAENAQRRADDERNRLQNDLDETEAKLKKAQSPQIGW